MKFFNGTLRGEGRSFRTDIPFKRRDLVRQPRHRLLFVWSANRYSGTGGQMLFVYPKAL